MTRERRDGRRPFAERLRDWRCLAAAPKEFDRRPRGVKTAQAAHGLVSVTGTPPGSSGLPCIHLPKVFTYPNVATPYHASTHHHASTHRRPASSAARKRHEVPAPPLRFSGVVCALTVTRAEHFCTAFRTTERTAAPSTQDFEGGPSLARQKTRRDARNGCARCGRFVSSGHVCSRPSRTIPGRSLGRPVRRRAGRGDDEDPANLRKQTSAFDVGGGRG